MDLQYARLDAAAFALRASLELRARACAEHPAGNAVHELQAACCKHLWLLTVECKACTLHTQISARSAQVVAGFALMQYGAQHAVLQGMCIGIERSPADGLWMLCSRSSTSALEAYLATLNAWAESAKSRGHALSFKALVKCNELSLCSASGVGAFISQDAVHTTRDSLSPGSRCPLQTK